MSITISIRLLTALRSHGIDYTMDNIHQDASALAKGFSEIECAMTSCEGFSPSGLDEVDRNTMFAYAFDNFIVSEHSKTLTPEDIYAALSNASSEILVDKALIVDNPVEFEREFIKALIEGVFDSGGLVGGSDPLLDNAQLEDFSATLAKGVAAAIAASFTS